MIPWSAWLVVAWLAADVVFVLAWTMRGRVREREALEARFAELEAACPAEPGEAPEELLALAPPRMQRRAR